MLSLMFSRSITLQERQSSAASPFTSQQSVNIDGPHFRRVGTHRQSDNGGQCEEHPCAKNGPD